MVRTRVSARFTAAWDTVRLPRLLTCSSAAVPVTRAATPAPDSPLSAASGQGVSSIVSCSSAAHSIWSSAPVSARIVATASGWVMYGSPLLRV
jgi:hypothetical protein